MQLDSTCCCGDSYVTPIWCLPCLCLFWYYPCGGLTGGRGDLTEGRGNLTGGRGDLTGGRGLCYDGGHVVVRSPSERFNSY